MTHREALAKKRGRDVDAVNVLVNRRVKMFFITPGGDHDGEWFEGTIKDYREMAGRGKTKIIREVFIEFDDKQTINQLRPWFNFDKDEAEENLKFLDPPDPPDPPDLRPDAVPAAVPAPAPVPARAPVPAPAPMPATKRKRAARSKEKVEEEEDAISMHTMYLFKVEEDDDEEEVKLDSDAEGEEGESAELADRMQGEEDGRWYPAIVSFGSKHGSNKVTIRFGDGTEENITRSKLEQRCKWDDQAPTARAVPIDEATTQKLLETDPLYKRRGEFERVSVKLEAAYFQGSKLREEGHYTCTILGVRAYSWPIEPFNLIPLTELPTSPDRGTTLYGVRFDVDGTFHFVDLYDKRHKTQIICNDGKHCELHEWLYSTTGASSSTGAGTSTAAGTSTGASSSTDALHKVEEEEEDEEEDEDDVEDENPVELPPVDEVNAVDEVDRVEVNAGGAREKMIDLLIKDGLGLSATLCAALVDKVGCEDKRTFRSVRLNLRQNPAVVTALTNAQGGGGNFALLLRCVCDLSIFTREKEQIKLPIRPEGADEYRYVAGQFLPRE